MKRWRETQKVFERLAELHRTGRRAALATVVRVRGSAYRREGAKLLVAEDGSTCGNVSGGCLELDVREVGLQVLRSGRPQLRRYCSSADETDVWDLGLGCNGRIEIYVEPVLGDRAHERELLNGDAPFEIRTTLDGSRGVFVEVLEPPPYLVLIGAGDDARPLGRTADDCGFRVVVIDRRAGLLAAERFCEPIRRIECEAEAIAQHLPAPARSYAVIMTHRLADDRAYLRALLATDIRYIGVLGPRHRTEQLLESLDVQRPTDRNRIHGPAGLDLGAEGAEQVAVAILAEILAAHSGRDADSLRKRAGAIHDVAA